jgi:ATP-dependent RNA helicase TDRD9
MDDHINYDEPGISDKIYELGVTFISVCLQQIKQAVDYKKMRNGTILIFLPGLNEIENFHNKMEILEKRIRSKRDDWPTVCILHSSMSSDEQYNALKPVKTTKIILSTNIAESSLTIPNVTHVIDFYLTKFQSVAKGALLSSLILSWSSKQNSKQRAGRCGRLCNGSVIRMVHKTFYEHMMKEYQTPEMTRVSLESVILKTNNFGKKLFNYTQRMNWAHGSGSDCIARSVATRNRLNC